MCSRVPVVVAVVICLAGCALVSGGEAVVPSAPSFRQDVIPVLTRYGCNAGACHGKLAGQNGFKLSLRGYAPEIDYQSLTRDLAGRRIDLVRPEQSLILLKASGGISHLGHKRFDPGSRPYQTLRDWVAARAPAPDPTEADAVGMQLLPAGRTMKIRDEQQLVALAHYPDGHTRDVTWLARFSSNDEATVMVSPEGMVKALRPGSTAVRAHFQQQVAVVTFTIPFDNTVDASAYSPKNNLIDEHVFPLLEALRLPPSPPCEDTTFCRRAFLDSIGTLPAPSEVQAFLDDPRPNKRQRLVDAVLNRPEYADYWAQQLGDLLQNRRERDHDVRGIKGVRSLASWLRRQVAINRPWNELAREVITATGEVAHEPPVGYFLTTIGESQPQTSEVGDSVAQAFLGARIGCARCHNHPLERYTQDDYYHFIAFFSRVQFVRKGPIDGVSLLKFDKTSGPPEAQQPRTGKMLAAAPLDRTAISIPTGHDPRQALAGWITDPSNELFASAMVNRLWAHFMSVGLVEPVDDLRSSNPPSNPALLTALDREFIEHGYDLKHLMRLILNSRAYQLSSSTLPQNEQDHKFYSHYFPRRLPAEVMADAIASATGVPDEFPGYPVGLRAIQLPDPGVQSYFLTVFGRSERVTACACERSAEVTLPQLLYLNNGDDLRKKLASPDNRLAALIRDDVGDEIVVRDLFLATLARPPTPAQVAAVMKPLATGAKRQEVFRDLFWALLNSREFAFNH